MFAVGRLMTVAAIGVAVQMTPASPGGLRHRQRVEIAHYLEQFRAIDQLNGAVLVAKGDHVIFRGAYGLANIQFRVPNKVDTKFLVASITKTLTATMIMRLQEQHRLALDAKIETYLPRFPAAWASRVTIEQLLTHTGGVQGDISDFPTSGNDFDPQVAMVNGDFYSLDEQLNLIAKRPLLSPPGAKYSYSSDGYSILGAIVAAITGKPYDQALSSMIFRPLGMGSSGYVPQTQVVDGLAYGYSGRIDGYENGRPLGISPAGGAYSTVDDLFKWLRAVTDRRILSQDTLERIWRRTPYITAYGWKVRKDDSAPVPSNYVQCSGAFPGYNALVTLTRSDDYAVIVLTNTREVRFRLDEITKGVLDTLRGRHPKPPQRSLAMQLARSLALGHGRPDEVWRSRNSPSFYLDEGEINLLGYELVGKHELHKALKVFKWNTEAFPNSFNAFDSLGEIYYRLTDKRDSIANYRRSLALNPGNQNAAKMLHEMSGPPERHR